MIISNWLHEYGDCPGGMMSMMAGGLGECERTMDDATDAMGFQDAGEYASFLVSLSQDEREMILTAVDEWLDCER